MEFFMAMNPPTATAQEHKITVQYGKVHIYDPPELISAKSKLKAHLSAYAPKQPMRGPLKLTCVWQWQPSDTKHRGFRTTRPDTDNLQKMLKDVMTRCRYWNDDAQVVDERCIKQWAAPDEPPGIYIRIEEI